MTLSRRSLLIGAAAAGAVGGGGLVWAYRLRHPSTDAPPGSPPELNAWVQVRPDDTVVIRIAHAEMGQGTLTGLAQLVAEELDCDWNRITTEYASPSVNLERGRVWGGMLTGGSSGIRGSQEIVRRGGAAARLMLLQAAADGWSVPVAECSTDQGIISHGPSGRRTTYGAVADAAGRLDPPRRPALREPTQWRTAGRPLARLDTADKLTGRHVYGSDLRLPGMLAAAIKACPVFGGTLAGFDSGAIAQRPGVRKVLQVGDKAVAVVADTWWRAKSALEALPVRWNEGPNAKLSSADIDALVASGLDADDAVAGLEVGDARAALAGAARRVEAVYAYPFQAHATMETMNATAHFVPAAGDAPARCEVWAPTQAGESALKAVARASGLPIGQCRVHRLPLGGGFGRRLADDWLQQAVRIAKELPGTPVKLVWSREEDMLHDHYHPVTQCKLRAGLSADGKVESLHMRIAGQSIVIPGRPDKLEDRRDTLVFQGLKPEGEEAIGYSLPHLRIDHALRNPPVPPGFWRGVNLNQNIFYLECFVDEIAHALQRDPLDLRRELMRQHPKHLAVLEAVAAHAGWGKPAPAGVHRGLAQGMGFGSYVAACAEVSVDDQGQLTIHRIVAATDCGHAVNPQQIEAQVEGSFAYGLSAALYGACTLKDGRMQQANFDSYPVLQLAAMPAVETLIRPSGGFWGGVGEPTIAVAAPAVLNAVFAATGKRIRRLPLAGQDLRRA